MILDSLSQALGQCGRSKMRISDERVWERKGRKPLFFLSQTLLVDRPLFRSSPLTESVEQVRFTSAYHKYHCGINCRGNIGNLHDMETSMLRLEPRFHGFSFSRETLGTRLHFTERSLGPTSRRNSYNLY